MQKEIEWLLREKYNGKLNKNFNKDVKRLKVGEPVDYVIGFTEFLGCKIDLSKKPLIPRPETEYWVAEAIEKLKKDNRVLRILDIFAGSGCIGVSIVSRLQSNRRSLMALPSGRHFNGVKVVFAEKDKKLTEQIKINYKINQIPKNKYEIIQSDIFSNITGKFDYIFANPPYIPTTRKSNIQKAVLKYEPTMALFGGKDGLLYIRKFLAEAKNFLKPGGKISMEFDSIQKKQIEKLVANLNYKSWKFHKDQYEKWRWVIIKN